MRIICKYCNKPLDLADDKIPPRPFLLTCPSCKQRQQIDPSDGTSLAAPTAEPGAAATAPPASQAEGLGSDNFLPLPSLRPQDAVLMESLYPEAFLVDLTAAAAPQATAALRLLGIQEVQHFNDLETATAAMAETQVGILMIVMEKAPPPPSEPLLPLYRLPLEIRRRTFVVLMAENVRSLDGQVAFLLQTNCLIHSQEIAKLPLLLRRAVLHHLRLYRFWSEEADDQASL